MSTDLKGIAAAIAAGNLGASPAIQLIEDERVKQSKKGFDAEHDDVHRLGELTEAAQCHATVGGAMIRGSNPNEWPVTMFDGFNDSIVQWPFNEEAWKPKNTALQNLVIAAALLVAEIERLQRIERKPKPAQQTQQEMI